ncbi:hypothetical protein [Ralstonia insidiosa]|jgi:hypothetical protein|nr:hypothetical protein [Ralstonia insidiosa]MBA9939872.1 hypothetical protein [Ralstonia insidiosa]MBC9968535.1 hypothetical protein [Ralstonia insidiosa]MBX3904644.1 hypothetical protein [Ralstonia insidiosa]
MIKTAKQRAHANNTIGFTVLVFICGHVFGSALMVWMVMRAISLDDLVRIGSSGISESALQALAQARALYPIALGMCAVALVAACVAAARHQVTRRSGGAMQVDAAKSEKRSAAERDGDHAEKVRDPAATLH